MRAPPGSHVHFRLVHVPIFSPRSRQVVRQVRQNFRLLFRELLQYWKELVPRDLRQQTVGRRAHTAQSWCLRQQRDFAEVFVLAQRFYGVPLAVKNVTASTDYKIHLFADVALAHNHIAGAVCHFSEHENQRMNELQRLLLEEGRAVEQLPEQEGLELNEETDGQALHERVVGVQVVVYG